MNTSKIHAHDAAPVREQDEMPPTQSEREALSLFNRAGLWTSRGQGLTPERAGDMVSELARRIRVEHSEGASRQASLEALSLFDRAGVHASRGSPLSPERAADMMLELANSITTERANAIDAEQPAPYAPR